MNEPHAHGLHAPIAERISALSDGYLTGDEFVQAMTDMHADPLAVPTWQAYHLVGDILRDRTSLPVSNDFAFLERLNQRLALEPSWSTLAGEESGAPLTSPSSVERLEHRAEVPGANAPVFAWKRLVGALSTVLLGVVGVALWEQPATQTAVQVLAPAVRGEPAPQFVVKEIDVGRMVRDPQLDALMAAHQQLGGHSALQVPTGFLRNATFEEPAR